MKRAKFSAEQILSEFNSRSKLSELISRFVDLKPRGKQFIGKCPFHNEKTPSFNVNDEKGLFYCFGCKVGGNVISFLQKYNNFSFLESIKYLSDFLGVDFYNDKQFKDNKYVKKIEILNEANELFKNYLAKNKFAQKYLNQRGISSNSVNVFHIGFCPDDETLINYFKKKKYIC